MDAIKHFQKINNIQFDSVLYSFALSGDVLHPLIETGAKEIHVCAPVKRHYANLKAKAKSLFPEPPKEINLSQIEQGQDDGVKDIFKPEICIYNYALGDCIEHKNLYLTDNDLSEAQTFLKWQKHKEYYPSIRLADPEKVLIQTIDDRLPYCNFDLIYLNQNGYELKALIGAEKHIAKTKYIIVPIFAKDVFFNAPIISDFTSFLRRTHSVANIAPVNRGRILDKYRHFVLFQAIN